MAVGQNISTNPFDEPSEEDNDIGASASSTSTNNGPSTATHVFPFIRIPILLACTTLVFVLLIAGTATTALSFPPKKPPLNISQAVVWDGDYKLLGPLLLTAGCFLLCVDIALCAVMIREAYQSSKMMIRPGRNAWNSNAIRPLPLSLVGGPFFIATTDPAMTHPSFLPMGYNTPGWVHPNAPFEPETPDNELSKRAIRPETATLSRNHQPPCNPHLGMS